MVDFRRHAVTIDNLKHIIIFVYIFLLWKIQEVSKKWISVSKYMKLIGRLIVPRTAIEFHEDGLWFGDLLSFISMSHAH